MPLIQHVKSCCQTTHFATPLFVQGAQACIFVQKSTTLNTRLSKALLSVRSRPRSGRREQPHLLPKLVAYEW